MLRLLLLGTSGCHLCDQAEHIVNEYLKNDCELIMEKIDISENEQFHDQFAIHIPVLYHPQTAKEIKWPFDQTHVKNFIVELTDG